MMLITFILINIEYELLQISKLVFISYIIYIYIYIYIYILTFKTLNKVNVGKPGLSWAFNTELAHA